MLLALVLDLQHFEIYVSVGECILTVNVNRNPLSLLHCNEYNDYYDGVIYFSNIIWKLDM